MAEKYNKAPLVYVSTVIRTTALPELIEDQQGKLDQSMIAIGLPTKEISEGQQFSFEINQQQPSQVSSALSAITRFGYFKSDKTEALILHKDAIEFRCTVYDKFDVFCQRLDEVFKAIFSVIDSYKSINLVELTLSYVDLISPFPNRELRDYFDNSSALPINIVGLNTDAIQTLGNLDVTQIIKPEQKVNIALEQLPIANRNLPKLLPNSMVEPDAKFSMPLQNLNQGSYTGDYYVILLIQSMKLLSKQLGDINFKDDLLELRSEVKKSFKSIINKEVCDEDWELVEE